MVDAVNPLAPPPRGDRARATRLRIVLAARDLFLRDGYAATTLQAIADRAAVAVQTVYFHFGNKRTVLKHVVDVAASGDDEPVALLDRPWVTKMRAVDDAEAVLEVWAEVSQEIYERIVPVMRVVRQAAGSDPDMEAQERTNRQQTLAAHGMLAEHLAERRALRHDLDVAGAAEQLFVIFGIDVHVLTTGELAWPVERWRSWAVATAARTVLR